MTRYLCSWAIVSGAVALAGSAVAQFPVNVLQDCWTTYDGFMPDPEFEAYEFMPNESVTFVWKHKIMEEPCQSYVASIFLFECIEGKPRPKGSDILLRFMDLRELEIWPYHAPEFMYSYTVPAGYIPPGQYDWALIVECNDSGNGIGLRADGDIDDECGVNVGMPPIFAGPVIFGPEPIEFFDPHPGGFPPGRWPGEEGTTRPWCFVVR